MLSHQSWAAVFAVLAAARSCEGAVIDSTWYPYAEPLARSLPGPVVELGCRVPLGIGPLLEVDTAAPVDVPRVAASVRSMLTG